MQVRLENFRRLLQINGGMKDKYVQMAMNADLDYRIVRDSIYTHPSMTEAFNDLFANLI
jgi:hypothetical protein